MTIERVYIITGSSSGIGATLARRIARTGTAFVLHARRSKDALEQVAEDVRASGAHAVTVLGDLAEKGTATLLVDAAIEHFGRVDVVVANAGFPVFRSFEEGTAEDLEYAFKGNLYSLFELARAAREPLKQSTHPRLVAVGSYTAHYMRAGAPLYPMSAASKGAIEVAVRSLANNFASDKILVNCVIPGEINSNNRPVSDRLKEVEKQIPLGRLGRPEEVAEMIWFLTTPQASYITGQMFHVNGGLF
ncbi:SDR family NAD(P)-dependent oxidoreductase [Brucellaceae bacterium C25G]